MLDQANSSAPGRLILGLGNPGAEYRLSRHNRGREVVEELARRRGLELTESLCSSRWVAASDVVLSTPETYMNRSGYSARCLRDRLGIESSSMLVVFDDVALPLGGLRMRAKGSPGGQKGMASIIENLHTESIPRLRLGIAPVGEGQELPSDLVDFVLEGFTETERQLAEDQIKDAADACEFWLANGTEATMNRYNGTVAPTV